MAARKKQLLTLSEVSKRTGISMPTLQRYKKSYQSRIPSEGEGRSQRYPKEALAVFEQLKKESLARRGRPRRSSSGKATAAAKRKKAARKTAKRATGGGDSSLISLSEIGRRTGISYPTLVNYVKRHLSRIPHSGTGRKRRFPVEAVAVFRELRAQSKPGRPRKNAAPASASAGRKGGVRKATVTDRRLQAQVRDLERAQREISKQLDAVLAILKQPVQVTIRSA
jgi:DNA-binding transcriptional MerR regulator